MKKTLLSVSLAMAGLAFAVSAAIAWPIHNGIENIIGIAAIATVVVSGIIWLLRQSWHMSWITKIRNWWQMFYTTKMRGRFLEQKQKITSWLIRQRQWWTDIRPGRLTINAVMRSA